MNTICWLVRHMCAPAAALLFCLAVNGCDGDDTAEDSDTGTDTGSDVVCEDLEWMECVPAESCAELWGNKIDFENECLEADAVYFGCATLGSSTCSDAYDLGYGLDPDTGDCYVFSSPCYPGDWEETSTTPQDFPACDVPGSGDDEWFWEICS